MTERDTRIEDRTAAEAVAMLTAGSLREWLRLQRWAGAGGEEIESIAVADAFTVEAGTPATVVAIVDVHYVRDARTARMVVPMEISVGDAPVDRVIGRVTVGGVELTARDASHDGVVAATLARWIAKGEKIPTAMGGTVHGEFETGFPGGQAFADATDVKPLGAEQSNSSYVLDDRWMLKLLRRIETGTHPEVAMLRQLVRAGFPHVPRLGGVIKYRAGGHGSGESVIALLESFVANQGDAWKVANDELTTTIATKGDPQHGASAYRALGDAVASMHLASARATDSAFIPEVADGADADRVVRGVAKLLEQLKASRFDLTAVRDLVARSEEIIATVRETAFQLIPGLARIRIHGDLHLGQVLRSGNGFVLIDFEGEPMRPIAERHERSFAARDVAGMLRSFDYAAAIVTESAGVAHAETALHWSRAARERFLEGYLEHAVRAPVAVLPSEPERRTRLIALFELEKALYEVLYEIRHRPTLASIPVAGADRALAALRTRGLRLVPEAGVSR